MVTKVCKKCQAELPLSSFNKNRLYKDGLRSDCKECQRSYNKGHREEKQEYYRDFDRKRSSVPERKAQIAESRIRHRARHPDRYKARCAVNNAVRDGRLFRPDYCTVCLKTCTPEGHHHSYDEGFWLDVVWVCRECHQDIHKT